MSLVGTRPPTVDEWDKYELHHRARLATKPGLTGMWQVSGRSNITDFEEVVKLDKQYISEWTMGLDMAKMLIVFYIASFVMGITESLWAPLIVSMITQFFQPIQKFLIALSAALLSNWTFPFSRNTFRYSS